MRTKDILKEALRRFEGTVIVVSHDRDFLAGLADKVFEFANRGMKEYIGGVADFMAAKKVACFREYEQLHKPAPPAAAPSPASPPKDSKLAFAERKQLNRDLKKAQQQVDNAERTVASLEAQLADMEQQMSAGIVNDDLLRRYSDCKHSLSQAMDAWEQAMEAAEALQSSAGA